MPHPSWPSTGESSLNTRPTRGLSWFTAGQSCALSGQLARKYLYFDCLILSLSSQCWSGSNWNVHYHRPCPGASRERECGGHSWSHQQDQEPEDEASADSGERVCVCVYVCVT